MSLKILITGSRGQLGQDLTRYLSGRGLDIIGPSSGDMDIRRIDAVQRVFEEYRPDAVIHCAAYNQVDRAETEPELCRAVNVTGTENLARLSREYGAYLLSISTDYVFDGRKNGEYDTDDIKNPLSVYGASKSEGEDIVLAADSRNAVVRTSWLFGPVSRNFVEAIRRSGAKNEEISVVNDQVGSPTYTEDLTVLLSHMALNRISGLFHATNEDVCSRADFAREILSGCQLPCRVREISSESLTGTAPRPKNSRLSKACLDRAGLTRLPDWHDALARYLRRFSI